MRCSSSAMRRSRAWVTAPSSMPSATVPSTAAGNSRCIIGSTLATLASRLAEVAVAIDIGQEEQGRRASLRVVEEMLEAVFQPLRLPAAQDRQPAQLVARLMLRVVQCLVASQAASKSFDERVATRHAANDPVRGMQSQASGLACRPANGAYKLQCLSATLGQLSQPDPACSLSTVPGNAGPTAASALPSPAAARSAACTNWAHCGPWTRRWTAWT